MRDYHYDLLCVGATLAESDKLNDEHIPLDAAYDFLIDNLELDPLPFDREQGKRWVQEGYAMYVSGMIIRKPGTKPIGQN